MAGSLRKLVELPITPLVGVRSYQYTVHEDDAAEGLLALGVATTVPSGTVVGLAHAGGCPSESCWKASVARRARPQISYPSPGGRSTVRCELLS